MDHFGQYETSTTSSSASMVGVGYPPISHSQHEDYFVDYKSNPSSTLNSMPSSSTLNSMPSMSNSVVSMQQHPSLENETLQQLKQGFVRMMSTLERLEQRINRVEQTTSQILKNQQEVFQVPFMSQSEIERARQAAEQIEQDTTVAKQLQAAYNKEVELKKNMASTQSMTLSECPICGVRVNQMDLEVHVDQCLELFSNDPKKEVQVQETKKKIETGFFGRLFKSTSTTSTKTTETKVVHSATAPLLSDQHHEHGHPPSSPNHQPSMPPMSSNMYPGFGYPSYPSSHPNMNINGGQPNMPMMMPMYMYPSYPNFSNQPNE